MDTKEIIKNAEKLSRRLSQADVQAKSKGVDEGYVNQLLSYVIVQYAKDKTIAISKLKTLIEEVPYSGFAKRQFGKRQNHFDEAERILTEFKAEESFFDLPAKEIIQILGWTVKLMKYNEAEKGDN